MNLTHFQIKQINFVTYIHKNYGKSTFFGNFEKVRTIYDLLHPMQRNISFCCHSEPWIKCSLWLKNCFLPVKWWRCPGPRSKWSFSIRWSFPRISLLLEPKTRIWEASLWKQCIYRKTLRKTLSTKNTVYYATRLQAQAWSMNMCMTTQEKQKHRKVCNARLGMLRSPVMLLK